MSLRAKRYFHSLILALDVRDGGINSSDSPTHIAHTLNVFFFDGGTQTHVGSAVAQFWKRMRLYESLILLIM